MAQTILELLNQPFVIHGNQLRIDTCIGITLFPQDGVDADGLLRNADLALYRAKREGRGQYRFYSNEMDLELKATLRVESELRHAIEQDDLELFYQPTFAVADGRVRRPRNFNPLATPGWGPQDANQPDTVNGNKRPYCPARRVDPAAVGRQRRGL